MALIYLIFFLSGFPALVYQLVWQRALFTIYGVNIESITVVVAAFMVGLGLGSLFGGVVSRMVRFPLPVAFGLVELGIGAYGFWSLAVFDWAAELTAGVSTLQTFLFSFALVVVPTVFMGATLPILVAFLVRRSGNVGRSVGALYFVNTLGAAAACLAVALWLFAALGKSGAVNLAVSLNLLIGIGALLFHVFDRGGIGPAPGLNAPGAMVRGATHAFATPFPIALLLVALTGFISLSYEILWARMYSFVSAGHPASFPLFLGFFLGGIAVGAHFSRRFCDRDDVTGSPRHLHAIAWFVLMANIVGFLTVPVLAHAVSNGFLWVWTLLLTSIAAATLGAALPLLSHFCIPANERAGAGMSYLYVANILGSAAGSLITGFLLLQVWSPQQISIFLLLLGTATSAAIFLLPQVRTNGAVIRVGGVLIVAAIGVGSAGPLFDRLYERLQYKHLAGTEFRIDRVRENRSGVITVNNRGQIFGGGVYDGIFSVDLVNDRNHIIRPFALSALHPSPRKVLMIGLGSGSWTQVIANNPDVERVTMVEINPAYYEVASAYPATESLLANPKVEAIVDDARRWLAANPDVRFDAIVANTTFHWRVFATNLLSVEFLELIRRHLNLGGIYYFNSTWSEEAQKTAASVYPYAFRLKNMMVVSDSPIVFDASHWRDVLIRYRIDGHEVFNNDNSSHRQRLEEVLALIDNRRPYSYDERWATGLESREEILARTADLELITDDNMLTEWAFAR
ncbi:MAG: spermidine synthase [Thiotrichales bacterium]|nr:spermidine synthase [Thiotrichales bacterium]